MQRSKILIGLLGIASTFASCGHHTTALKEYSNSQTNVELSKANYEVKKRVSGESSTFYVLGIGGFNKDLISEARKKMSKKANLKGSSKALINVSIDKHRIQAYPFFWSVTYTASGRVIEFKE